ncbi:MAG: phosphatidate cytidylyltransferase [Candidatus Omnitrophica bacterium]|nr:phosphatidate cytidylyltransferase [Candidatus Omnitrophota bacterium]MDD5513296.1 phosphatidate cytidylyltransferase [Candidatus Omnitrophota bacterium]
MIMKRILSGIFLIGIVLATVFIDWFFNLMMVFFIVTGLLEFFTMLEKKGIRAYKYFGTLMGLVIPVSIIFRFELTRKWELLFIVMTLIFLIVMLFKRRENSGVIVDISTTVFGILYVSWFFSFLIKIRNFPQGVGFFISLLTITKLGDIGAYLVGMRLGKTPLIPRISPNKSVEGSIGGLVFSILGALACRPLLKLDYPYLVLLGLVIGLLGQLGDLAESLIKRDCQVKDSGTILPGMGGVLDVMDSLLFTAPVFYFYLSIILNS